ncbi:hypothetical protein [uncultured Chryseobacterium sp.]|uniref:hypothetical protein n=1 Tax=uncultured Chryseobacterium sp. TaxID=259322 RepID=UPI0025FD2812|nr:hypothetical protein [uncultured Chryseobacterium sp.]
MLKWFQAALMLRFIFTQDLLLSETYHAEPVEVPFANEIKQYILNKIFADFAFMISKA